MSADNNNAVLGMLRMPLTEMQDNHLITQIGSVYFIEHENIMDPKMEYLYQSIGRLLYNISMPHCLAFTVPTAVFQDVNGMDTVRE
jgi:hypothetical protein